MACEDSITVGTKLTASYKSSFDQSAKDFEHRLQIKKEDLTNSEGKSEYLAEMRQSARKLQDEINEYLTSRMELDKAAEAASLKDQSGLPAPKQVDEDMYGEEVIEEDHD